MMGGRLENFGFSAAATALSRSSRTWRRVAFEALDSWTVQKFAFFIHPTPPLRCMLGAMVHEHRERAKVAIQFSSTRHCFRQRSDNRLLCVLVNPQAVFRLLFRPRPRTARGQSCSQFANPAADLQCNIDLIAPVARRFDTHSSKLPAHALACTQLLRKPWYFWGCSWQHLSLTLQVSVTGKQHLSSAGISDISRYADIPCAIVLNAVHDTSCSIFRVAGTIGLVQFHRSNNVT